MAFSEDQEVIEQLVPQGSDEALDVSLHLVGSKGRLFDFRSLPADGMVHTPGEFRVPIMDNVPDDQTAIAGLVHE